MAGEPVLEARGIVMSFGHVTAPRGRGVAWLPGVDDEYRPPRPRQSHRTGEPGRAAPHHHDVVPLHRDDSPPAPGRGAFPAV
jgi:hypothetical protein